MMMQLGQVPTVIIPSAAVAKEALQKNYISFSSRHIDAVRALNHNKNSVAWLPAGSASSDGEIYAKYVIPKFYSASGQNASQRLRRNKIKDLTDLFSAGIDTTSTLEWAMEELLHNPEKLKKAQMERQEIIGKGNLVEETDIPRLLYLQAIIKETLKLHPPVPLLLRKKADTDVQLFDFNPERFVGSDIDVKGRDFELIPFNAGCRICPELPLANRMVSLIMGSLIHVFDWKLEDGVLPMRWIWRRHLGGSTWRKLSDFMTFQFISELYSYKPTITLIKELSKIKEVETIAPHSTIPQFRHTHFIVFSYTNMLCRLSLYPIVCMLSPKAFI
uniref:Uncharacterized protein n=1 Tax=Chenopodium quinoa TaxID=63459 RepID=A0A803N5Q1_CHEQI